MGTMPSIFSKIFPHYRGGAVRFGVTQTCNFSPLNIPDCLAAVTEARYALCVIGEMASPWYGALNSKKRNSLTPFLLCHTNQLSLFSIFLYSIESSVGDSAAEGDVPSISLVKLFIW